MTMVMMKNENILKTKKRHHFEFEFNENKKNINHIFLNIEIFSNLGTPDDPNINLDE